MHLTDLFFNCLPTLRTNMASREIHSGKKPKHVCVRESGKSSYQGRFIRCASIKSVNEVIHFLEDKGKWYFHLTYTLLNTLNARQQ